MNPGLSCEIPTETVSTCIHGVPVKFECGICHDKHRITLLESQVKELTEMYKEIIRKDEIKEAIYNQFMRELRDHKIRQIDENRKISRRVDELEDFNKRQIDWRLHINKRIEKLENKISEKYAHPDVIGRIERLEKFKKELLVDYSDIREIHRVLEEHYKSIFHRDPQGLKERIGKLEEFHKELFENSRDAIFDCKERIEKLSATLCSLSGLYGKIKTLENIYKFPHKCPVCDGQGCFHISGTMISGTIDSKCQSCEGKGIVWG